MTKSDLTIPYIEGHGIGPDIWKAAMPVFEAAFAKHGDATKLKWLKLTTPKREISEKVYQAIETYGFAIKGPLTTPVGGGTRSFNVELRQELDLYMTVRPIQYVKGVWSPMKEPEKVDMVIFRENLEDVYAGIEFKAGSNEAKQLSMVMEKLFGVGFDEQTGIGLKPMSKFESQRVIRAALQYAVDNGRKSVTMVHKGNIMKYTEGAFAQWGYELAKKEFKGKVAAEGEVAKGKVVLKDRIADAFFQQALLHPEDYDVIAAPNLNGDYISDALAAQVGGIGIAPSANIGDHFAVFETTHGSAPKYAGKNKANPGSLLLSGAMMFEMLGHAKVADAIRRGFQKTIIQKQLTFDLARGIKGAKTVSCSKFGQLVVKNL